MCGITGIVQLNEQPLDVALLERMTTSLAHRGPDGEGYAFLHPGTGEKPIVLPGRLRESVRHVSRDLGRARIGLGHRRLAIIDLTPLGQQPMGSDDGLHWITYNGEVYNAPELRLELAAMGHQFRSGTDTEVVLESYRRWGADCVTRLNGMFAFALWDGRARQLLCTRDRFGIKPFYYRFDGGRFLFASEIKALLEDRHVPRRPNARAVYEFLSRGRQDVGGETFFEGIDQLGPGQALTVYVDGRGTTAEPQVVRWWQPDTAPRSISRAEAAHGLRELLQDSVRMQMRADVPIGSCLSGGLDSSSIVSLMSHARPTGAAPIKTFTLCHDNPRYDERAYSRAVARQAGAMSQEVFADPARLLEDMGAIHWHHDEPIAGTSVLGQWVVMRAASQAGIKVLLDGQGGDEVLLGYPGYWGSHLADLIRRGRWLSGAREWIAWRRVHGAVPPTAAAAVVRGLLPDRLANGLRRVVTGEAAWMSPTFTQQLVRSDGDGGQAAVPGRSVVERHRWRTLTEDLPVLLQYEDRNAMAVGVEARVPFLDYRLVEHLAQVPAEYHLGDGLTKRLLREAMQGLLPESVRQRVDKMGFVTPEAEWLCGPWRPAVSSMLRSDRFRSRPYWRSDATQVLFDRLCDGEATLAPTIWRWVSLEQWMERFCD